MDAEKKQRVCKFLKTALLALFITLALVMLVATSKQKADKKQPTKISMLEKRISRLETAFSANRELLDETRRANENLRSILYELRGIHNDCQRNATRNFINSSR